MERLLIVEDDENLGRLYREEFAEDGYEVIVARSGEEAVGLLHCAAIDGVILDIRLGGMDGLEVLRRILAHRAEMPVVLNSAYATFKNDFASWSADAYVVKSSDLAELKRAVREALGRKVA